MTGANFLGYVGQCAPSIERFARSNLPDIALNCSYDFLALIHTKNLIFKTKDLSSNIIFLSHPAEESHILGLLRHRLGFLSDDIGLLPDYGCFFRQLPSSLSIPNLGKCP
jgi:hypothetical protein